MFGLISCANWAREKKKKMESGFWYDMMTTTNEAAAGET